MSEEYNILIVEDEDKIASIMKSYLKLYKGFKNIIIANDGVQALQKLSNQDFDLIITDIVMEKKDGLKFIDGLRKQPKYYNQNIMVVSGCLTTEITLALMRRGVRHIIVKPFTARQILLKAITCLKIDKNPQKFVDEIIQKVNMRMHEDRERLENAIPDEGVSELIKKSKGE
tara:strand:- start:160326 stop:160841 length:516 start_codon:yes stop_codon:yes gene_type:complete